MKDLTMSKLLQDTSAIIGSVLPIAQLFFSQWTFAFDHVFLAKPQFLGISIVTLIVSYVLIVAYLAKPYAEILLPGQRPKQERLQAYWAQRNTLQSQIDTLITAGPKIDEKLLIKIFKQTQALEQPVLPRKISQDNHIAIAVTIVILSAFLFVGLSFTSSQNGVILGFQSLAYILLVSFAALILTIYKKINDNNNHFKHNNRTRADKAIKLAIDANGFTDLPQVTFIGQYEAGNFNGEFHVIAEYKGKTFNITTDREAEYLISIDNQSKRQPAQ